MENAHILTRRGQVTTYIIDTFLRWKSPFKNGHILKLNSSLWKHFIVVGTSQEHSYVVLDPPRNRIYDLCYSFSLHVLASPCSWACIFADTAAAAIAAAGGSVPLLPCADAGGVMARPTLRYCPPKSKRFMDAMASVADCWFSYSKKPYPLCLPGIVSGARVQLWTRPNASNTLKCQISTWDFQLFFSLTVDTIT